MKPDGIFYSLSIEDIQTVALDTIERKLTKKEIKKIIQAVEDQLPWFDVISNAIESELT